ncbi:type II toxin-antitoxin system HicB family antitoxin [uncultured Parvimonas sp.]|uniref:type II toxin-antitoxin system HicB family antitoxin n=1 Tax=uncultured Parvimonas sp. TaxID=747372 RepID=UPI0025948457|nr:type II toxin-antitoxin system HicB family antitoxin [uncultured Parvimonas sp.]
MKKGARTYIALFKFNDGVYTITFPDLKGAISEAGSIEEAISNAKDVLEVWLLNAEDYNIKIPNSKSFKELENLATGEKDFIQYITVDLDLARKKEDNRAVKKTLTIPSWLNELAINNNINFSYILQQALKKELNVN